MATAYTQKQKYPRPPEPDDGVHYPDADGLLPVRTMYQFVPQAYMQQALSTWFANDPTALVASNMFIYYAPGDGNASVAPDLYVIPHVGNARRKSYFLWLEEQVPTFIVEIASDSTYQNDLGFKRRLYESWGVLEYWLYDPTEEGHLEPFLQGYRLASGSYEAIAVRLDVESGQLRGASEVLNLELHCARDRFRFFDPASGRYLLDLGESGQERLAAEQARDQERATRLTAEQARDQEQAGRLAAEQARDQEQAGRLAAEQARDQERAARLELERRLRERGIEPPTITS